MPFPASPAFRSLQEIERDIQANRKALYRAVGGKFDVFSAEAWQWAWDRHPYLYLRSVALNGDYCDALHAREARKQAKAATRHRVRAQMAARMARITRRAAAEFQCAA